MRVSRTAAGAALLAMTLLLGACGSEESDGGTATDSGTGTDNGGGGGGSTIEVVAQDFKFDQTSLDVEPGAEVTVTLTNEDDAEHTFTIEELDVEAEAAGGETADATFTAPDSGSYEFICEYHPDDMRGTLSVGGDAGAGGSSGDKPEKDTGEDEGSSNPKY